MMNDTYHNVHLPAHFHVRVEQYWQSVAIYAVTLIVYVVVKALWETTLQTGMMNVVIYDPVVVLLAAFVVASLTALIATSITQRTLTITDSGLVFTSRFHERVFERGEIEKIVVGRERRVRMRGVLSHVRVYIRGRRRPLRIRPAIYDNEQHLVAALMTLRRALHAEIV